MANPDKLPHSLSIALLLFSSLVIFELSSARPLAAPSIYPAGFIKTLPPEINKKNSFEENSGKQEIKEFQANYGKLGFAFGPALMNMLPKGTIPVSGPSRRINDANN